MGIMKFKNELVRKWKYQWSPMIPDVDPRDIESRRNWILFMARRTARMPVKEIYNRLHPEVSKVTINSDFKFLEAEGLIKRTKDQSNQSFVIPLFEDHEEKPDTGIQKIKYNLLTYGLPTLALISFTVFIALLFNGF